MVTPGSYGMCLPSVDTNTRHEHAPCSWGQNDRWTALQACSVYYCWRLNLSRMEALLCTAISRCPSSRLALHPDNPRREAFCAHSILCRLLASMPRATASSGGAL